MRIKSYFSDSVEAAIAQAGKELGPEAMVINSRNNPDTTRGAGRYEVVIGIIDEAPAPQLPAAAPPASTAGFSELADIRKQISDLQAALATAAAPAAKAGSDNHLSNWRAQLLDAELSAGIADEILAGVQARLRSEVRTLRPAAEEIEAIIRQEVEELVHVVDVPAADGGDRVMALVGPPGVGKTTTLVKIAVREGLAAGRSVRIISLDPHRVAASQQLQTYASIVGAGFYAVETFGGFMEAMKECRRKDLVLIDTPGFSLSDADAAGEVAGYFEHFGDIGTHLVLSASMKPAAVARYADFYMLFQPRSLMFTRTDESGSLGTALSESCRTGIPLSYVSCGQSIPEDIARPTAEMTVRSILGAVKCAVSVA